jgi:hypothetical protein
VPILIFPPPILKSFSVVTPRRQAQHVDPLAGVLVLQQDLPAAGKAYGIPVNEYLSAPLSVAKSSPHTKSIPYVALVRTLRPKVKRLALTL